MAQQETAWMQSPEGVVEEVPVDGACGELNRKMVAGWKQVPAPENKHNGAAQAAGE